MAAGGDSVPASVATLRAYNVLFGDCILVSIPKTDRVRHILFDFGNAPSGARGGGRNDVFPAAKDIAKRTDGRLDLVVMTHEHLDHMEGFFSEKAVFDKMEVGEVWMSVMREGNPWSTTCSSRTSRPRPSSAPVATSTARRRRPRCPTPGSWSYCIHGASA